MTQLRISDDLALPLEAVTQKFGFFAQSGAGKTYAATKFAELLLAAGAQVVVLDPVGVWWGLRVAADGTTPGFAIPVLGGEHGDIPLAAHAGALVADLLVDEGVSAVLDISEFELPDHKRFVRDFAERFFQRKKTRRSPVHLFLEEAQVIAPLTPDKDETVMLNRVERLCRIGRNYGVGWSIISQRPQDVHTKVRNQVGTLFALRTLGTHERKAIAEWVSDKARTKDELSIVERLPELDTGVAQVWSPNFLKQATTVKIAIKATFDSSATPEFGTDVAEPKTLADVDLSKLRERMAATIEQAKANDPHQQRRRIAELEQELARARSAPKEVQQIAVPVLSDDERRQLASLVEQLVAHSRDAAALVTQLQAQSTDAAAIAERIEAALASNASTSAPAARPPAGPSERAAAVTAPAVQMRPGAANDADDNLTKPQIAILNALATFEALGLQVIQRGNVAVWSGQSPRSSGYTNNLGRLRSLKLIQYPRSGMVALTEQGRARTTPVTSIMSQEQLHQAWYAQLPGPQQNILRALVERYPQAMSRDELAVAAGQSPTSSGYTNNLGALRSLGLLDYPQPKQVVATALLFPNTL